MNVSVSSQNRFTFTWPEPPAPPPGPDRSTWLTVLPPEGEGIFIAHDFHVDDGAHEKPPFEPRDDDLPETEKFVRPDLIQMTYPRAKLWFDAFKLSAPPDLEKLPEDLRIARDLAGNMHIWLDDEWYERLSPVDQWWLFLIYWSRAFTNKVSIDVPGYRDPITGFGVPEANGNIKDFSKEGITCGGSVFWKAQGVSGAGIAVWCLDALAELPPAEELLPYAFLWTVATVSTDRGFNPNPAQYRAYAKKGEWDVGPFGYLNGNSVLVPNFSAWDGRNAATKVWNGIPLRAMWLDPVRALPLELPWNPYVPGRSLFPR